MAMVAVGMADKIKSAMSSLVSGGAPTPESANETYWNAICEYVAENAEVIYQWSAVNPSGTPDPTVTWTGTIITGGTLKPNGGTTPEEASQRTSAAMNANVLTWMVKPAPGFSTAGPTITNPAINIKISKAATSDSAHLSICQDIIDGIKAAIPPVHSGAHGAYVGATTIGMII